MRRAVCLVLAAVASMAEAATYTVAPTGGDFAQIQAALDVAVAGDVVQVREGTPYFEKLVFPRSGDAGAGYIVLTAFAGEHPILDGTGVAGADMILIEDRSWVKVAGFEIRKLDGRQRRLRHPRARRGVPHRA